MSVELEARVRRANLITRDRHLERLFDDELSRRLLRDVYSIKEGRTTETTDRPEPTALEEIARSEEAFRSGASSRPIRRRPAFVPAVLTAVIAIGIIGAVYTREPAPDLANTPVEIAERFVAALSDYDVDTVMSLFADDVAFLTWPDTAENFPAYMEYKRVMGTTHEFDACFELGSQVRCPYVISDSITRAAGTEPGTGNFYFFTIEDGKITSVNNMFTDDGYNDEAMALFEEWMIDNHPADWSVMEDTAYIEPDTLALWSEHVPEFLARLEDSR
ncbi:MAG TPA: nuclear transport factor 2 family protein [Acidimicrobiia bacterium]|jgi:hypothetical protein|nr:SnoaL-like domain [Acidimicrobiia bacterium]HYJ24498.1 nuclear transport factor 2 family protein [Acidimicrobiia bacterium]